MTKETNELKFDFQIAIKRLDGEPMYEQDENGNMTDKPYTMKAYLGNILWNARDKEQADINNAILAMKIYNSKLPITLKTEERTLIKNLVKKVATPGIMYQVDQFLEGKDPFE